jgi:glycerophosphoryl diester phosphodiesterase
LYDLATDTGEDHNVAFKHPEIIRRVRHFFAESTVADAPFFPYPPDTACRLHVLDIGSPEDMKDFFHYSAGRLPFISSHRGGPALGYPENCLATFTHTIRHTWSILEVDPHYTKDSIIILMHDPTLDRTSTGHGKISDHTLAQLEELNLKDDQGHMTKYRIPTLDQALEWAKGRTVLILDQKDVSAAVRAEKIRDHHAETCAMVMCYSFADAKKCYEVDKNIMMEVFIPDLKGMDEFANSGVPWANVVAFVSHFTPKDPRIFQFLHDKGVMTIRGSSRTIDRAYQQGKISKKELQEGYRKMIIAGADIIESDLGVQAGREIINMWKTSSSRRKYFSESPL